MIDSFGARTAVGDDALKTGKQGVLKPFGDLAERLRRGSGVGGGFFGVETGKDRGQVLRIGEEANDVGVVGAHDVEPSDREALDPSYAKSGNATQLPYSQ